MKKAAIQFPSRSVLAMLATVLFSCAAPQVTQEWAARYNGPGNSSDGGEAVAVDSSGNVYVTGESSRNGVIPQGNDYATIKYDSQGNQLWAARYNGPADDWDIAFGIAVDGFGNVYVTGWSRGSGTGLTTRQSNTIRRETSCGFRATTDQHTMTITPPR